MYVVHAEHAEFISDANNPATLGKLTLYETNPEIVSYNPLRSTKVTTISLKQLVDDWNTIFVKGPPNAGFVFYHDVQSSFSEITVVLKNPQLDLVHEAVSFTIEPIGQSFHDDKLEMNAVTLFIDGAGK